MLTPKLALVRARPLQSPDYYDDSAEAARLARNKIAEALEALALAPSAPRATEPIASALAEARLALIEAHNALDATLRRASAYAVEAAEPPSKRSA